MRSPIKRPYTFKWDNWEKRMYESCKARYGWSKKEYIQWAKELSKQYQVD